MLGRNISWTNKYDQTDALTDVEGVEQDGVFAFKAMYDDDICAGELETLGSTAQALTVSCRDNVLGDVEWRFIVMDKGGTK